MATLRLEIGGAPGSIPVAAFLEAARHELAILRDLDRAISGSSHSSLDWIISDLRIGSAVLDAQSRPRDPSQDNGKEVSRAIVDAILSIERDNRTPAYLSPEGMRHAKGLVEIPERFHLSGQLTLIDLTDSGRVVEQATITPASRDHIRELLDAKYQSIGSVEGKLEGLNVHGKPKFTVYEHRTRRAVTCVFDYDRWIGAVKDLLRARIRVSGRVESNARGEILRVEVGDIEPLPDMSKLPRARDLYGADPDFTGGVQSDLFIRGLRSA
jgi:hypothetical protein